MSKINGFSFLEFIEKFQKIALTKYGFILVDVGGSYEKAISKQTKVKKFLPGIKPLGIGKIELSVLNDISIKRPDGTTRDFDAIAFPATNEKNQVRLLNFKEVKNIGYSNLKHKFNFMERELVGESFKLGGPEISVEMAYYHIHPSSLVSRIFTSLGIRDRWHRFKEYVSSIQIYNPKLKDDPRGRIKFRLGPYEKEVSWDSMQIIITSGPENNKNKISLFSFLPHAEQKRYRVRTLIDKPQDLEKISSRGNIGKLISDLDKYSKQHRISLPDFSSWDEFIKMLRNPNPKDPMMKFKFLVVNWWFKKRNASFFKNQSVGEWASHNPVFNWLRKIIS